MERNPGPAAVQPAASDINSARARLRARAAKRIRRGHASAMGAATRSSRSLRSGSGRPSRSCSPTSSTRPGWASGSIQRRSRARHDRLLRGREACHRGARRDARQVHRRRSDGRVRPDAAARGRRIARRPNGSRDASDAGAPERGASNSGTESSWRPGRGSTQARLRERALSPIATSWQATRRTRRRVSSRPPNRARFCWRSRRTRLVRESAAAELVASVEMKGKQSPVADVSGWSSSWRCTEPAPRLDAPLVGRQDTLAQLEWALERAVTERSCRLISILGAPGVGESRLAHEFVVPRR